MLPALSGPCHHYAAIARAHFQQRFFAGAAALKYFFFRADGEHAARRSGRAAARRSGRRCCTIRHGFKPRRPCLSMNTCIYSTECKDDIFDICRLSSRLLPTAEAFISTAAQYFQKVIQHGLHRHTMIASATTAARALAATIRELLGHYLFSFSTNYDKRRLEDA